MILIVDSGSTKTDWCFASSANRYEVVSTVGINPIVQTRKEISTTIDSLFAHTTNKNGIELCKISHVYFYGAGCTPQKASIVKELLSHHFTDATTICVNSDLLAACHALCGKNKGFACIFGTGANSCYYDGKKIASHIPPLGYILGDEGSGAALGKKLLNAIFKNRLSKRIHDIFMQETQLDLNSILDCTYHQPAPNKFLASFSVFVSRHIEEPELENLVIENFEDFICKNIIPYTLKNSTAKEHSTLKLNAVGSIAYYFKPQLIKACAKYGIETGEIQKSPMANLIKYYME